ncbi:MAG: hypothetical protein P4M11_05720 [Candidatus Pacebacteria bacterium]|nr:hypothetical protein [Candidatus Paceibacterota bacterium]
MDDRYINPFTNIAASFDEAKEEYGKYGYDIIFGDKKPALISDLVQGKRNVVVGEPGIGKSKLLEKMKEQLDSTGYKTSLVLLRSLDSASQIEDFLTEQSELPKALLLDAFDEVPASAFATILQKIKDISENLPDLTIYISARWVFIDKYASSFASYRFITILPFTQEQMTEYLVNNTRTKADVDALFQRVIQFSHGRLVIQIPRYLFLFEEFLEGKNISDVKQISRNELFEHFIYSKLEIEAKKNSTEEMTPIVKRLLEKLALTMEIYQANTITYDELVTFFDDLDSDLKLVVLTQLSIETLLNNSILQRSKEDADKLEFDNAEFQEYLAAKEITRLTEPRRAAFNFAADSNAGEIYPSWLNTLSFLMDMEPDMLGQLLDFSGIRNGTFKIVDESFLTFLSRINPTPIPVPVRERLFNDVLDYHEMALQWIPGQLTSALPGFFSPPLEVSLKTRLVAAEAETGTTQFVRIANLLYVVAYLLRSKITLDTSYWRAKLIQYASLPSVNSVLVRHALLGLECLGDSSVIEELPDMTREESLIVQAFISMCTELDPNNPRSVDYFVATVKRNDLHGRYGLYGITEAEAIKHFLRAYNADERFRREFLDDTSIFKEQDLQIVDHIGAVADAEIRDLAMEAIIVSVHYSVAYTRERSSFVSGLMIFLHEGNPDFVSELIRRIRASEGGETGLYFAQEFFTNLLSEEDIPSYIDAMVEAGSQSWTIMQTMIQIKLSGRESADAIYEAGRERLLESYTEYEAARARPAVQEDNRHDERLISQFRLSLEPSPGKYMTRVFYDYNHSTEKLEELMTPEEKERFDTLITGSALLHDPANRGLTITAEADDGNTRSYTASGAAQVYGDALIAAKRRGIDIAPFRRQIARFIPFAHNEELKTVFELIPDFTVEEIGPMIAIYHDRDTDLWRYQPDNFVEAAEKYNLTDAAPIVRDFVKESGFRKHDRIEALSVTDFLQPDAEFLEEIFDLYVDSESTDEKEIASAANGLLITRHDNYEAVTWRLAQLKVRAPEYTSSPLVSGVVRAVTPFDEETRYGKTFAKPLMEFKNPSFEEQYLALLDDALEIWAQGDKYHGYAQYLWDIVYAYIDNLKERGSYKPLRHLEVKIASLGKKDGANWLASRMVQLRRAYLSSIGKPPRFAEAIRRYNVAREYGDKKITNSADLFSQLQDAIDVDLRQWIEGEGAYELILTGKVYEAKIQEYEKLIQRTLKAQIENIMLKRGFQIDMTRESVLLDDKRADILVRYGFVGPIVVEVKLTSNSDMKARNIATTKSHRNMTQYMIGYGASHGLFLVIDNTSAKNLPRIKETFGTIKGVTAVSLDCYKFAPPESSPTPKTVTKKAVKKVVSKKASRPIRKVTKRRLVT